MGVRVLGRPALVGSDGRPTEIRGGMQTGLLALLVAHRGRPVRPALLQEELWGSRAGGGTLRVTVRRLRVRFEEVIGYDPIVNTPGGYALDLPDDDVDEALFRALLDRARGARRLSDKLAHLRSGEALWAGPAFDGVTDLPSVQAEHFSLENLRDDAREMLAACALVEGQHADAISLLRTVTERSPYRESSWALHVLALYRSSRQREALATYEDVRRMLSDQVGLNPGPELTRLHRDILDQVPVEDVGHDLVGSILVGSPDRTPRLAEHPLERQIGYADRRHHEGKGRALFVGRAGLLSDAERFIAGELGSSVLVVEGPAGIGKTSLGREVAAAAGRSDLWVAWGSCPRDPAAGMVAVRQILADVARAHGEPAALADHTLALLDETVPDTPDRAGDVRTRLYAAAEQALRTPEPPCLVVVDDVQWISSSGASLIGHLVKAVPGVRWLLLTRDTNQGPGCTDLLAQVACGSTWRRVDPLTDDEVGRMVADHVPRADRGVVDLVVSRSGGLPFLAVELARHLADGGDPSATPRTVEAVIGAELDALSERASSLCSAVAVAGGPTPVELLVAASGVPDGERGSAVREVLESGLVVADGDRSTLRPAHDLIREEASARMDGAARSAVHRALAEALRHRDDLGAARLGHLLSAGSLDPAESDDAAAAALGTLLATGSVPEARELGLRYVAASDPLPQTRQGVQARLHLAAALFAGGEVYRAERVISAMKRQLHALDDPVLLADALLTRSAFTNEPAVSAQWADEAMEVLDRLPGDDAARRVRLACWAAHLYLRACRRDEANKAARLATTAEAGTSDVSLSMSVLMLEFRMALAVDQDPRRPDQIISDAEDIASAASDGTIDAVVAVARLDGSLRTGTVADYRRHLRDLEAMPAVAHHAELRWTTAACQAALDLASGDLDAAATSYLAALQAGGDLGVGAAPGASLLHRLLLDWDRGTLGAFHALLPSEPAEEPTILIAQGLVSLEAGDLDGASAVADALAERTDLLVQAGVTGWQLVAAVGPLIAWRTDHAALAGNLGRHLSAHAGYGLSMNGLAYLGAADRAIGLVHATLGDAATAVELLTRAHDDDLRRGAPLWAARASCEAAEVRARV